MNPRSSPASPASPARIRRVALSPERALARPRRLVRAGAAAALAALSLLPVLLVACSEPRAADAADAARTPPAGDGAGEAVAEAPLPGDARRLLELALRAAAAIPAEPHLKDRSRAQEAVVAACLELDQPQLARACAQTIDNWRRGACQAQIAEHLAARGDSAEVRELLASAHDVARRLDGEGVLPRDLREPSTDAESAAAATSQAPASAGATQAARAQADGDELPDWRRDRIRVAIARTHQRLGQTAEAERLLAALPASQARAQRLRAAPPAVAADFDAVLAELDGELASGDFDRMRAALDACVALFEAAPAAGAGPSRRAELLRRVREARSRLPLAVGLELLSQLAASALDHGAAAGGPALIDELQALVDGAAWLPEDRVPLLARLAALRGRAGQGERARRELQQAVALYDASLDRIADVFRAATLRPVAEAWHALGETSTALAVYARAVEAGLLNPNGRPRAEDLAATCRSMALHGAAPDAALLARLEQACAGLGAPW